MAVAPRANGVGNANSGATSSSTATVNFGSGAQVGDLVFVFLSLRRSQQVINPTTPTSGTNTWALLGRVVATTSRPGLWVYAVVLGSTSATSITLSGSGGWLTSTVAYDPAVAVGGYGLTFTTSASSTSAAIPASIEVASSSAQVLTCVTSAANTTWTPPTGASELSDQGESAVTGSMEVASYTGAGSVPGSTSATALSAAVSVGCQIIIDGVDRNVDTFATAGALANDTRWTVTLNSGTANQAAGGPLTLTNASSGIAGQGPNAVLNGMLPYTDFDVTFQWNIGDNDTYPGLGMSSDGAWTSGSNNAPNNGYGVAINAADTTPNVALNVGVSGVQTALGSANYTYPTAGTDVFTRYVKIGSTHLVWQWNSGSSQPASPQIVATDSSFTTGMFPTFDLVNGKSAVARTFVAKNITYGVARSGTASGSLALSATGGWQAPSASGALTLGGSGTASGGGGGGSSASGAGALSLAGSATWVAPAASGAVALSAAANWIAPSATATLALSAAAAWRAPAATGSVALGASANWIAQAATGALALSATGTQTASATGTAALTLTGSAGWITSAANAAVTLAATGSTIAPAATGTLALAAAATDNANAAGSAALALTSAAGWTAATAAALSLTGTATGGAPASGTGALGLTAGAADQGNTAGSGAMSLIGTAGGGLNASGAGDLTLAATAAGSGQTTGLGALDLTATGASAGQPSGSGLITLTAGGLIAAQATATGMLVLSGTADGLAATSGTAALSLLGQGMGAGYATAAALLDLLAQGVAATAAPIRLQFTGVPTFAFAALAPELAFVARPPALAFTASPPQFAFTARAPAFAFTAGPPDFQEPT